MTQGRLSWGYWVDYDNDGFLDLLVTAGNAVNEVNYLYHNRLPSTGNRNNWLKVRLVGKASNSMGVGAKLRVTSVIEGSSVQQLRQMMAPLLGDHQAFTAHFGLGDASKVDTLRIEWPSGIVQELTDVDVNQQLEVVESQGVPMLEPLVIQNCNPRSTTVSCPVDGVRCVLETSVDLEHWSKLQVRTSAAGTVKFSYVDTSRAPTRFYRVLVP